MDVKQLFFSFHRNELYFSIFKWMIRITITLYIAKMKLNECFHFREKQATLVYLFVAFGARGLKVPPINSHGNFFI